jgi:hypothetical protein
MSRPGLAASRFLAEMAAAADEALDGGVEVPVRHPRFEPLPQDHGDFLLAMSWFTRLNPDRAKGAKLCVEQRILLWRSKPVPPSFADIGEELKISAQHAQRLYRRAIDRILELSNAPDGVDEAILAVRARNRVARRAA